MCGVSIINSMCAYDYRIYCRDFTWMDADGHPWWVLKKSSVNARFYSTTSVVVLLLLLYLLTKINKFSQLTDSYRVLFS